MKKIITLFALLVVFASGAMAQANLITIDSARTNYTTGTVGLPVDTGVDVSLIGVVYGVNSYKYAGGVIFTLNDHHAGIKVYSTHSYGYTVNEGDSVLVTGKLNFYRGEEEITPNRTVAGDTILYLGHGSLDGPTVVTTVAEANESQLIEIDNVNLTTATGWLASPNLNYSNFTVNAGTTSIYIDSFTSPALFMSAPLTGIYNVIGIGSQYCKNPPFTTGYQIAPRGPQDFIRVTTGISTVNNTLAANVFPNPAANQVMVTLNNDKDESLNAQLIDVTGRVVLSETRSLVNGTNDLLFNTTNVTNGIYILELHTSEKSMMTKIIVAK